MKVSDFKNNRYLGTDLHVRNIFFAAVWAHENRRNVQLTEIVAYIIIL
jgi:hypothetical protein